MYNMLVRLFKHLQIVWAAEVWFVLPHWGCTQQEFVPDGAATTGPGPETGDDFHRDRSQGLLFFLKNRENKFQVHLKTGVNQQFLTK